MSNDVVPAPSAEQVEAALRQQLRGKFWELRVVVRAEGVVLQGSATCYYGKQLAQHFAHKLFKLPILANEIEVRWRVSAPQDDVGDPSS
jgi:hypothetical protein